eukprot:scaffold49817_cov43-Attheya_sp.AAC.1
MGSHLVVHVEKGPEFGSDILKVARLESRGRLVGVAVDGFIGAHADNNGEPSGGVVGVHGVADANELVGCALVRNLDAKRVANATDKFEVCAVQLTGALSDPEHVGRAVVPLASGGVLAGECLFVGEEETFVCRVKVCLGEGGRGRVYANGLHESEGLIDLGGELAVARALIRVVHKVQVPGVQARDVGVSSGGEGAQDVEGLGTLVVGLHHVGGVVATGFGGEVLAVDNVSAVGGQ